MQITYTLKLHYCIGGFARGLCALTASHTANPARQGLRQAPLLGLGALLARLNLGLGLLGACMGQNKGAYGAFRGFLVARYYKNSKTL